MRPSLASEGAPGKGENGEQHALRAGRAPARGVMLQFAENFKKIIGLSKQQSG
ncbi:hypothetical protein V8J88_00445 [Massilia sp. W12]|uniref:hypothetical protein n=1 Tax=Massilia sp. W12 TaxID=3126507 RepID=UPI0030CB7B01